MQATELAALEQPLGALLRLMWLVLQKVVNGVRTSVCGVRGNKEWSSNDSFSSKGLNCCRVHSVGALQNEERAVPAGAGVDEMDGQSEINRTGTSF
jgi:hypothetical protein